MQTVCPLFNNSSLYVYPTIPTWTLSITNKTCFYVHARTNTTPVTLLMSHYMLPFHKLQNYFLWLLFHVAQVIWAIPSITVMPCIIKVGKHAFLAARCKVIPLPSQPWQRQAKWKMVWLSFQPNALLLKSFQIQFQETFQVTILAKRCCFSS